MSLNRETLIHLVAGGCGGTMGAIVTCPLEIVKTRLQSSSFIYMASLPLPAARCHSDTTCSTLPNYRSSREFSSSCRSQCQLVHLYQPPDGNVPRGISLFNCLKYIVKVEGPTALFRGLGPNLVGVAPSRAIYFCSYSQMKKTLTSSLSIPENPFVHIVSAAWAGFIASTLTNPIWMIKTRLQLDHAESVKKLRTMECINQIYKSWGIAGFYKGITASYYGISETVIHFVIYEGLKAKLQTYRNSNPSHKTSRDFFEFMLAGATSKTIASTLCYPHEVARTRLRETGKKYRRFWQTLGLVVKEEGVPALYRGLVTQLLRQIPNTAIMMATYEGVVYYLSKQLCDEDFYKRED